MNDTSVGSNSYLLFPEMYFALVLFNAIAVAFLNLTQICLFMRLSVKCRWRLSQTGGDEGGGKGGRK